MNQMQQLVREYIAQGFTIPVDLAVHLADAGFDTSMIHESIDGFDIIDPTEVDYFDYIDQNH